MKIFGIYRARVTAVLKGQQCAIVHPFRARTVDRATVDNNDGLDGWNHDEKVYLLYDRIFLVSCFRELALRGHRTSQCYRGAPAAV